MNTRMQSIGYLKLLLADQRRLQQEVQVRNSALFDPDKDLTIDEALTERKIIEHTEEELRLIDEEIIMHADLGFFGISHPGGLTTFFYGYHTATRPHSPGHQT